MSLWCDKYRPTTLNKLDFNPKQAQNLKKLVASQDFGHLILSGPPGAGKKTRVNCLLKEIFGSGAMKMKIEYKTLVTPSKRKLEIKTLTSNYHVEVNPSDVGLHDRVVVMELIKEMAQNRSVTDKHPFKVVVITEAEKLSKDAQQALRRTMEKFVSTCKIILTGTSTSSIIPAVKSRCLMVRVAAPSVDTIAQTVMTIARKEGFHIQSELAKKIAVASDRNVRRALLMAETMKVQGSHEIVKPHWVSFIEKLAKKILESQTIKRVEELRSDFYELCLHLVPPTLIFRTLVSELLPKCEDVLKLKLIELAAFYEHNVKLGSKPIFHLEAFASQFMAIYKKYVEEHLVLEITDELLIM